MGLKQLLIILVIGYFVGCIQNSYLLIKFLKNEDIRERGSFNAGASNTVISYGWKLGALVCVLDILKAYLYCKIFAGFTNNIFVIALAGAAVIVGHCFPFFMGFRGGKGTASGVGLMLVVNWQLALIAMAIIFLATIISNYIVIGTMMMWLFFTGAIYYKSGDMALTLVFVGISFFSFFLHYKNIIRIIRKEEIGFRSVVRKK